MISQHAWVVLLRDDGTKAIVRASRNSEVKSGHSRALGDQLVGHPYGSTFEFRDDDETAVPPGPFKSLAHLNEKRAKKRKNPLRYSRLVRVEATEDAFAILKREDTPGVEDAAEASNMVEESGDIEETDAKLKQESDQTQDRDNRGYHADTKNQKADSISMRNAGASGQEIVRALAENSVTFNMKTKFSQEKYLKRITRKHVPRVTVVRATSRTVAEVLFSKHPPTMFNDTLRALRWVDSLPQMLAYGNVHAGARCLVLDGTSGLLSLGVLERLRETEGGRCFFVGTNPKDVKFGGGRAFIDLLNIPRHVLAARFVVCSSKRFNKGSVVHGPLDDDDEVNNPNASKEASKAISAIAGDEDLGGADEEEEDNDDAAAAAEPETDAHQDKRLRPTQRTDEEFSQIKQIKETARQEMFKVLDIANGGPGADSLIIAARQDPSEALDVLLPHLGLGRPFAVHHPCLEPLMVARAKLAEAKSYLDLAVTEAFCREYQVLKDRTHPTMSGSATGGFILRGIKVQPWKDA